MLVLLLPLLKFSFYKKKADRFVKGTDDEE